MTQDDVTDRTKRRIDDLRRDLNDGDDLASAMALIGDVLHRRVRRVQRSLDELRLELDSGAEPQIDTLARRIRSTLGRFEREVGGGHDQLVTLIEEFQATLDVDATRLEQLHGQADG